MTDLIGKTLGKYQIVVRVGRGGMARVYKAYQASLDRNVALKVLHSHLAEEPDFVKRFEREATAVARLRHPNIVQVYDYAVEDELYYIVMEFVEGPTLKAELSERLKRQDKDDTSFFSYQELSYIAASLGAAIDYAHSKGMIHRDLKPGNIMFTADGQVLLTDFGLARMAFVSRHSQTGSLSGTPAYMAPEQVQGKRVDERSDVYSLGVVLYEMFSGRVPFTADTSYAIMTKHVTDEVPSLREFCPDISDETETVILQALSKQPDFRFQTAGDLATALQEALGVTTVRVSSGSLMAPIATLADSQEMMGASTYTTGSTGSSGAVIASPYRGLYAFREEDAPFFFGRESFVERLTQTLDEQSMAAVIGPSGSGKSSVVFAGLLPQLRERQDWSIIEMRPGSRPYHALAGTLVDYLDPEMSKTARLLESKELAEAIKSGQLELADVIARLGKNGDGQHLLIVDQFEELYTLCNEEKVRHRFPNALFEAVAASRERKDLGFSLVLTLRADFMGQALTDRPFADALQDADVKLGPMTRAELGRAIESPAAKKGVIYEAGLVDRILDDVGDEPGNLPLLEFALTLLWERRTGRRLSHAGYDTIGRVEGALARYADQIYEDLTTAEQERARRVFTQMVRPGEGTEDTRRLSTRQELGENDWGLAQRLADARLVVTGRTVDGLETVEVVHEALIRGWSRLLDWMNAERTFRSWQERMRVALRQWEDSARDDGALLRGVPLGEAEEWLKSKRRDLGELEYEYIQESINVREQRAAEREAQHQRELEAARRLAEEQQRRAEAEHQRAEEQTRSTRRLRSLAVVLAVVFLIAVFAAIFAVGESRDAERQADARATEVMVRSTAEVRANENAVLAAARAQESANARVTAEAERFRADESAVQALDAKEEAENERDRADDQARLALSRQLAAQSTTLLGPQLDLALLLSLEANNINDSAETISSILGALQASPNLKSYLRGHPGLVQSVAFSPDSEQLATAGSDGTVLLWDVSTGKQIAQFEGHDPTQLVNRVAFSPDGSMLATASDDLSIILWDVETRDPLRTLSGHTAWVQSLDFSPDGSTLVSGGGDRDVTLWNVATGELVDTFSGHSGPLWDTIYSPDGTVIASGSSDGNVILWDAESGEIVHTLADHNGIVYNMAFDPSGETLISGSIDNTMILWDVASGEPIGDPFAGHVAGVTFVDFSPDGQSIVSSAADSTLRMWDTESHQQTAFFGNHNAFVSTTAFSPDGHFFASGDGSGMVLLWDASVSGQSYARALTGHIGAVNNVDFHPTTGNLISTGADSTVRFWDVEHGLQIGEPITHGLRITSPISSLAFSANGNTLASGSSNGTLAIWDIASGQMITQPISAHANGVADVAINSDATILVAGGEAGFVTVWDPATVAQIGVFLGGHGDRVNAVAVSPDSQFVASGGADGAIVVRTMTEIQSGQAAGTPLTYTQSSTNSIVSIAFSPDSQLLASADNRGELLLWNVTAGQVISTTSTGFAEDVVQVLFSPDGNLIAAGNAAGEIGLWQVSNGLPSKELLIGFDDSMGDFAFSEDGDMLMASGLGGVFAVWDVANGELIDRTSSRPSDLARVVAINSESGLMAAGGNDGHILVTDFVSGGTIGELLYHSTPFLGNVSTVAYNADGTKYASAGFDGAIVQWDAENDRPLASPLTGHTSIVVSLAYSPDGKLLASGSCEQFHASGICIVGEVIIWDAETGQMLHVLRDTVGFPQGLAISPNGQTLAASDCDRVEVAGACVEGAIRFWDVDSGEPIGKYSGHSAIIWSLAYRPDGKVLASSSGDNTIILWDIESGLPIGQQLTNHGGPVRRVAFSPDGTRMASAGFDNLVFLWDVESGQVLGGPIAAYTANGMDVEFSPDGSLLASSSIDGTIIITDVEPESWRARACQLTNRNLRSEEWERFFGDQVYRETCFEE